MHPRAWVAPCPVPALVRGCMWLQARMHAARPPLSAAAAPVGRRRWASSSGKSTSLISFAASSGPRAFSRSSCTSSVFFLLIFLLFLFLFYFFGSFHYRPCFSLAQPPCRAGPRNREKQGELRIPRTVAITQHPTKHLCMSGARGMSNVHAGVAAPPLPCSRWPYRFAPAIPLSSARRRCFFVPCRPAGTLAHVGCLEAHHVRPRPESRPGY